MTLDSQAVSSLVPTLPTADSPAVDVGMPAYRRPQFIGEAIESVLAQTHPNWRLVVSENGPGGGDVEAVVRRYTDDPRVHYVATGRNLGPTANWTRLFQTGEAPYVTLIQDDDVWDRDFLARRVAFLEEHSSCGFVYAGERKMDQDGRPIDAERTRSLPVKDVADVLPEGVYEPREFIRSLYRHKLGGIHTPAICSLGVMSRRSALEAVGPYLDDDYQWFYWDVELYLRMALRFCVGFMAVKDATQRIHHPSITSEHQFDGEYWIGFHQYHRDWFRRELPGLELPREADEILADAYIMAALDALERDDRRKGARHLRSALRHFPRSVTNPRVAATAAGLLLGRRSAKLLARARAARHRRGDKLIYADGQR